MKNKDAAMALIKLLDKAEFRFSAVDALYFAKIMDWLKEMAREEIKETKSMELSE